MNFKNKNSLLKLTSLSLSILTAFSATALVGCSQTDAKAALQKAKDLYEKGNIEEAEYQLVLYLQDFPSDIEANILLGDWYSTDGNDKSLVYYRKAAKYTEYDENSLNYNTTSTLLSANIQSFTVKPAAKYTKSMTVSFSGNLFQVDKDSENGRIYKTDEQLEESDCKTTKWFSVNNSQKNISVYGKINCALWQFKNKDGEITYYEDDADFNSYSSIRYTNKAYSTAEIPEDAVSARLTYYDPSKEDSINVDEGVYIEYGSFIQGYTNSSTQTFTIPDLSNDDYVEYKDGKWTLYSNGTQTALEFDKISDNSFYMSVAGDLIGELDYTTSEAAENKVDKSKKYGISYKADSTRFACKRTDDAVNMNFNYKIDDEWANTGANDFDNAYPWCEMKRCNVSVKDNKKTVTYEGDSNYKEDGSNGNVMVEIPKFYTKRTVKDGYENISISGEKYDGYQVDPAFIGSDGKEADHIYVGAYFGSINEGDKILSVSQTYPEVKMLYKNTLSAAEKNGKGYSELDYVTYSALQKLFMIETGNINSSSVFSGVTADYYFYEDENKSAFAIVDAEKSNTIILGANTFTSRLAEGDSISIFSDWEEYKNTSEYQREIESITRDSSKNIIVTFSGDPVDIKTGKTAISNIPIKNGKTDNIDYCTGITDRGNGKSPFKYRGIENLYGSVMTILSNANFTKQEFNYSTADGSTYTLNADIPFQKEGFSDIDNINRKYAIKSMAYDSDNPLVMLPSKLGNGASALTSYGDYWLQYSSSKSATTRYIAIGGANDNFQLAGLFHMRAMIDADSNDTKELNYIGSRIMYR